MSIAKVCLFSFGLRCKMKYFSFAFSNIIDSVGLIIISSSWCKVFSDIYEFVFTNNICMINTISKVRCLTETNTFFGYWT